MPKRKKPKFSNSKLKLYAGICIFLSFAIAITIVITYEMVLLIPIMLLTLCLCVFIIIATRQILHNQDFDKITSLPKLNIFTKNIDTKISKKGFGIILVSFADILDKDFFHTDDERMLIKTAADIVADHFIDVYRVSYIEYAIIINDCHSERYLIEKADNLLTLFSNPIFILNRPFLINIKCGLLCPTTEKSGDEIFQNLSYALKYAKNFKSLNYVMYRQHMKTQLLDDLQMEKEIADAILDNQFYIMYQPKYDINTGNPVELEAFLRWDHPKKGLIYPNDFIPLAERTGQIYDLGNFVINTVCDHSRTWSDNGFSNLRISINLSPLQIKTPAFLSTLCHVIDKHGISREAISLCFEEESDFATISYLLKHLSQENIRFELDNFGKNIGSLNLLLEHNFHCVKFDNYLMDNMQQQNTYAYIKLVTDFCKKANIKVVGFGVPNLAVLNILKSCGVDMVQGYWLSYPLPFDNVLEKLQKPLDFNLLPNIEN